MGMLITSDKIIKWESHYSEEEILMFRERIRKGVTPLEFCELNIKTEDKLFILLRPEIIPEKELHLLACEFAEDALKLERKNGRDPHFNSWNAIKVKRLWIKGKATDEELEVAELAAWEAADSDWEAAQSAAQVGVESAWLTARATWEVAESAELAIKEKQLKQIKKVLEK